MNCRSSSKDYTTNLTNKVHLTLVTLVYALLLVKVLRLDSELVDSKTARRVNGTQSSRYTNATLPVYFIIWMCIHKSQAKMRFAVNSRAESFRGARQRNQA